ncbi:MAG: hypothetical protein ABI867_45595 [Kofleriaceae bacterium]
MPEKSFGELALYVWDYFYCSNVPQPGDEKVWKRIENATCRIRQTEVHFGPRNPPDVRRRHARRSRNAIRLALRQIVLLSQPPERWVIEDLHRLDALVAGVIESLGEPIVLD